jgi:hypothetical protein
LSWQLGELARDAARAASVPLWRAVLVVIGVGLFVFALTTAELSTTQDVIEFQRTLDEKGLWVGVLSNPDGMLSARNCQSLESRSWVVGAGGVRLGGSETFTQAPSTPFQTAWVTPGVVRIWTQGTAQPTFGAMSSGAVVGEEVATEVGLAARSFVQPETSVRPLQVGAVVNVDNRFPNASRWLMYVTGPVGTVNECWIEIAPGSLPAALASASLAFPGVANIDARPLISLNDLSRDPATELSERPQADAWIAAGAAMVTINWLVTWFRRSDIGLYRALGTDTTSLWFMSQIETILLHSLGAIAGYSWAVVVFALPQGDLPLVDQLTVSGRTSASAVLVSIALSPLATFLVGRDQVSDQLKDR